MLKNSWQAGGRRQSHGTRWPTWPGLPPSGSTSMRSTSPTSGLNYFDKVFCQHCDQRALHQLPRLAARPRVLQQICHQQAAGICKVSKAKKVSLLGHNCANSFVQWWILLLETGVGFQRRRRLPRGDLWEGKFRQGTSSHYQKSYLDLGL